MTTFACQPDMLQLFAMATLIYLIDGFTDDGVT